MSTQFTNRQWRLPNNENKDKQSNYSMDFDGGSETIALNTSTISFADSFSISMWINPSSLSGFQMLFGGSGYSRGNGIAHYIYDDTVRTYVSVSGSTTQIFQSSALLNIGSWTHIIIQREKGTKWEMWIDGVLKETNTSARLTDDLTSANSTIAKHYNSGSYNFDGKIDAFSIYNYSLSQSQVTTLYGSSSTGIGNPMSLSPAPVAYYPLGDQDAFNGADYLVPNSSLKDYVFDFDGTNDRIISDSNSGFTSNDARTFSAWIKSTDSTGGNKTIIQTGSDGTCNGNFELSIHQGKLMFNTWASCGSGYAKSGANVITDGNWHHILITYDGSNINGYVDGSLAGGDFPVSSVSTSTLNTPYYIGGSATGSYSKEFNGSISNVQVFNSALPATGSNSVETIYNNGSPLTSMTGFTSLIGWWKLDASDTYDGTNWTIEDHAGSNDGTSSGMTQSALQQSDLSFKTSISPFALDFDGTNDYIDCGDSDDFSFGNGSTDSPFSVSAWVNFYDMTSSGIISKRYGSSNREYGFQFLSNDKIQFTLFSQLSGTLISRYYNTALTSYQNQWIHLVGTYDGSSSSNGIKIYLNGNRIDDTTFDSGTYIAMSNGGAPVWLGWSPNTFYAKGNISNVSIWNTELTSAQVSELYNEGVPQNLNNHSAVSSLVSWWQLGTNSSFNTNWTVLDEVTASGNNGTSVNMGEDSITDGVNSYANGVSSGMSDNIVGSAPFSDANSLSYNMDVLDRSTDVPN